MTYVVVELCVDCKYTDCAAVCPVEAFHELPDRLYINADTCIDCDACVPECPVEAIFADTNVPEQYAHWTQINIDEAPNYPVISQKIPALHGPTCTGPEESLQTLRSKFLVTDESNHVSWAATPGSQPFSLRMTAHGPSVA